MAFTLQTWARVSTSANEGGTNTNSAPRLHIYRTPDAAATYEASGYFGASLAAPGLGTSIRTGDQVQVTSTGDVTTKPYNMTRNDTTGVITVTQQVVA